MSAEDQQRWDARYAEAGPPSERAIPSGLIEFETLLPTSGRALDVACGAGHGSIWLVDRGLEVVGIDVSAVAVDQSKQLAEDLGLSDRCQFHVHDLDDGLPDGPKVDLVLCHLFNGRELDAPMLDRLRPNGILAMTVLSEVGAEPGLFRVGAGELLDRFAGADVLGHREADGRATIVVRAAGPQPHGRLD